MVTSFKSKFDISGHQISVLVTCPTSIVVYCLLQLNHQYRLFYYDECVDLQRRLLASRCISVIVEKVTMVDLCVQMVLCHYGKTE